MPLTAERKAELFGILKEKRARGDFARLHEPTEDEKRWLEELEMLESQTERFIDLPLEPDGSRTIRVRRLLTEREIRDLAKYQREIEWAQERIDKAKKGRKHPADKDLDIQEDMGLKIIALVTVNPAITTEYLQEKLGILSARDLGNIILDNYLNRMREMEEVTASASFRGKLRRPGVRGLPEPPGDSGPGGVPEAPV